MRRNATWLGRAAAPAAAMIAYLNAFSATFQFDDRQVILYDSRLRSWAAFWDHLTAMIRPLVKFTYLVDWQFFGAAPAGYHLLNLLLHAGSALLVFSILDFVVTQLQEARKPEGASGRNEAVGLAGERRWLPPCAALLFAVHPLATETVTYISGRPTGLASFLALLSVYLGGRATAAAMSRSRFVVTGAASLGCFVLALLSKETAIVAPALLLLIQVVVGHAAHRPRRVAGLQAAQWAVAIAFASAALFHPRYAVLVRASLDTRPAWQNLLTEANAVFYALSLFFAPSRLNFDHDLPVITSVFQWPVPLAIGALAALAAIAVVGVRRWPLVSLGLGWFFIALLPAHSVMPRFDVLSERNLYLPGIGIFMVVGALFVRLAARLARMAPRGGLAAAVLFLGLLAGLTSATAARNRLYASEVSFWQDAVEKSPRKSRPHVNLGFALRSAGDIDGAIQEFRTALALNPDNIVARRNLVEAWEAKRSRE